MRKHKQFICREASKLFGKLFLPTILLVAGKTWAQTYTLIDLATLAPGTTIVVRGPNTFGHAVGVGRAISPTGTVAERRGLVFERGTLRQISGLAGSDYTTVFGINDVGAVVGGSNTATTVRAFVSTPAGGTRELPPLPGDTASTAFAVNNLGEASGYSSGPGGEHAVIWSADNRVTALPGPSGIRMRAYGLNERRDVVGVLGTGSGPRAVLWPRAGSLQTLPVLPGHTMSEAMAINASGAAVGYSSDSTNARRAVLWSQGGGISMLGMLPEGDFSQAYGINDAGHVVGTSASHSGSRAVIWTTAGVPQDLNTLITPSPVVLTKAVGINNLGMIIALGHDAVSGSDHGHEDHELPVRVFLLTRIGAQP